MPSHLNILKEPTLIQRPLWRQNALAYAAVLGMSDDLKLHGQQYPFLGSIFYFGYMLMGLPTIWMLTHLPIGKYVSTLLILWGGCNCMMAACTTFAGAAIIRFFLGMLEAGILPACIVITAGWYRREEQPLRTALWYGPFSGVSETWPRIFQRKDSSLMASVNRFLEAS